MLQYGADEVRGRVREAAEAALAALEARAEHLLLHFDVDVIDFDDFPAAEVPHREGLTFDEAFEALAVFLASRQLAGLVITEFNADQDTDGMLARRLVNGTVYALERALRSRP
jgi:arginase family enzyme